MNEEDKYISCALLCAIVAIILIGFIVWQSFFYRPKFTRWEIIVGHEKLKTKLENK